MINVACYCKMDFVLGWCLVRKSDEQYSKEKSWKANLHILNKLKSFIGK